MKKSKIIESRDCWKNKAINRGIEKRRAERKLKRLTKENNAKHARKIKKLEKEIKSLNGVISNLQQSLTNPTIEQRTLCVLVVIVGIVSFRSVPRILKLFRPTSLDPVGIPHFTSVINWTLRAGVALYRQVRHICEPWVCVIDSSIDVGTRKALVALRVPLSVLSNQGAICLKHCECIGIEISHCWNGELVCNALEQVFFKSGYPVAIIKDGGSDLRKGVRLLLERFPEKQIHVIDDVGHFTANGIKAIFAVSSN